MLQTQSILHEEVEKGGESQTKWVILALGSRLLIILTDLRVYENTFSQLCFFT